MCKKGGAGLPADAGPRELVELTLRRYLFHVCPGIRTLTVFAIFLALTTTPTGSGRDFGAPSASDCEVVVFCSIVGSSSFEDAEGRDDRTEKVVEDVAASIDIGRGGMSDPLLVSCVAKHLALRHACIAGRGVNSLFIGTTRELG